jgi:hypothetical protein
VCPHIALFRSAPSYEHLRVFSCACYPYTAATTPYKLAPRSTWCVFLSYSYDHKGYRCLDLSTNRLIVSRHVVFDEDSFPIIASPNPTDLDFFMSLAPRSPPLEPDSPLQVPWHLVSQPRNSLWDLSHLWLPFLLRQSLQDFCPERHRLLRHARPRPLLLHRPLSRIARHPVSGRLHRSPTSVVRGSQPPRVPLHCPLFGHLPREVRAWWCLSHLRKILTGWSHRRRMASECYLIDSSSPPRLRHKHRP